MSLENIDMCLYEGLMGSYFVTKVPVFWVHGLPIDVKQSCSAGINFERPPSLWLPRPVMRVIFTGPVLRLRKDSNTLFTLAIASFTCIP